MAKTIGGFLPLQLPDAPARHAGFLSLWGIRKDNSLLFHNARSALHHLLKSLDTRKLWLPAYVCRSVVDATARTRADVAFYPVAHALTPDVDVLARRLAPNDCVLAIDYFGRNPAREFLRLVETRRDVTWIEDRAQAMRPAREPWGDWILYSPRKLLGVPDGGILVRRRGPRLARPAKSLPLQALDFMEPSILRFEDQDDVGNKVWREAYVRSEKEMRVSALPMSRLTRVLLGAVQPQRVVSARKANYRFLWSHLKEIALFDGAPGTFVPMVFPIRVEVDAGRLAKSLVRQRVFAQRHWLDLPSDPRRFPAEHDLSRHLLSLPCDQRYSEKDMAFVVKCVSGAL